MTALPRGGGAVMNMRREPPDSLDYFPTPPWATRALFEHVLDKSALRALRCWEPAAGHEHMADVLREYFADVVSSDVFDYGRGYDIGSFVGVGPDVMKLPPGVNWICSNAPFNLALEFALRCLEEQAIEGFALLLRSNWVEGSERHERLFSRQPPAIIAQFVERVPMTKGRWDPDASTMTSYAWFVWFSGMRNACSNFTWIPPGCRSSLSRPGDTSRFAMRGLIDPAGEQETASFFGEAYR